MKWFFFGTVTSDDRRILYMFVSVCASSASWCLREALTITTGPSATPHLERGRSRFSLSAKAQSGEVTAASSLSPIVHRSRLGWHLHVSEGRCAR